MMNDGLTGWDIAEPLPRRRAYRRHLVRLGRLSRRQLVRRAAWVGSER
jgi:hypothetical protein